MKLKKIMSILGLCVFAVTANAGILKIENPAKDSAAIGEAKGLGQDKIESIQKSDTLVIVNGYTKTTQALRSAAKDAEYFSKRKNTIVFQDVGTSELDNIFDAFTGVDCPARKDARVVWLSGHGYGRYVIDDSGFKSHQYSFITNDKVDENTSKGMYEISRLLAKLAASDCKFVLGIDADSPRNVIDLPRNVTVIWANYTGGTAYDGPSGSLLTQAFAKAMDIDVHWTANTLTSFLAENILNPTSTDAVSLNKLPIKPRPWVQNRFRNDTIYFPSAYSIKPSVRYVNDDSMSR